MKNKKFSFKKFVNNEKIQFTFLAILSIVILLLSVIAPKWLKSRSNILKSGNNTQLVEKKSRIVNDNEIWNDNLIVNSTCFVGYDDWITYNVNDTSSYTFNYVHNDNTKYVNIFLDKSYNNKSCICFMPTPYYNVRIFAASSDGLYENRLLWVSNGRDRIVSCYVNQAIDHFAIEFQPQETRNITLSFMVCDGVNIPNEYQPYGQIGYTKEYYDYQMEQTPLNIIQQNMTLVNDKMRWTFPSIYNNRFANYTILDKSLKVFVYYQDISIESNRIYNNITYSQTYKIRGRYDVTTKLNEDYINIDNSQSFMNNLIGYEVNCYLPIQEKELLLQVWFNNPSFVDEYIENENEEREVITYSTNTLKNISLSSLLSYSNYREDMILVNYIEFYKNNENDVMVNQNKVISYESNIVNNDTYKYYNKGIIEGIDKVRTNPNDYNLYTQSQYTNYGNTKYQEGVEQNYSFINEVGGLINMPFTFAKDALGWDFFGINLYELFASALGVLLIIWILKKFLK